MIDAIDVLIERLNSRDPNDIFALDHLCREAAEALAQLRDEFERREALMQCIEIPMPVALLPTDESIERRIAAPSR